MRALIDLYVYMGEGASDDRRGANTLSGTSGRRRGRAGGLGGVPAKPGDVGRAADRLLRGG